MVKVYANNGYFNISESLLESIKNNNPELLKEYSGLVDVNGNPLKSEYKKSEDERNPILRNFNKHYIDMYREEPNINKDSPLVYDYKKFLRGELKKKYKTSEEKLQSMSIEEQQKWLKSTMENLIKDENKYNDFINQEIDTMAQACAENKYSPEKWGLMSDSKKEEEIEKEKEKLHNSLNEKTKSDFIDDLNKEMTSRVEAEGNESESTVDAEDAILLDEIIKNGGDISKIKIDGKDLTDDELQKRFDRNINFKKAYDSYMSDINTRQQIENIQALIKNAKNDVYANNINPDDYVQNLLNSPELTKEIDSIEYAAQKIIKRCKRAISGTLGIVGTNVNGDKEIVKSKPETKQKTGETNPTTPEIKQKTGEINPTTPETKNIKSGVGRNVKSYLNLAMGGYKIAPLINSKEDNENIGKALSYYKAYTKLENDKSLVDNLIKYFIQYKSNKESLNDKWFKEENKENNNNEENKENNNNENNNKKINSNKIKKEVSDKLVNVSINFLHNVVYKLQISDDSKYESIIRAIRYDNNLTDKYNVKNAGQVQIFNIREQSIAFQDKNTNAIILILIAEPLFAKGAELFNKAKKLFRDRGNIKA